MYFKYESVTMVMSIYINNETDNVFQILYIYIFFSKWLTFLHLILIGNIVINIVAIRI